MRPIKFLNLLLAAVLVAIMLGILIWYSGSGLSASAYISRQQAMIRALNTPMPLLGAATILLTLVAAFFRRSNPARATVLAAGAVLLVGSGVITKFCNQPINALVITWNAGTPPANWELLRDQWMTWHVVRTMLATMAFVLLLVGHRSPAHPSPEPKEISDQTR